MAAEVSRHADAVVDTGSHLLGLRCVPDILPVDRRLHAGDAIPDTDVAERTLRVRVADLVQVLQPELDRVHVDRVRGLVHRGLEGERPVRMAHAAIRAGLVAVGHHVDGLEAQVRDLVEVLHVDPRAVGRAGTLCADVRDDLEDAEGDRPVAVDPELHLVAELGSVRARDEVLIAGVVVLDRAAGELRQDRGVDFREVDAASVAVARSEITGLQHAHLVLGDLEGLRQARPRAVSVLVGVGHVELVAVPVGQRVRELERDVLLGRLSRHVVDDHVGLRRRGVAADERCGHRDRRAVEVARELLRGRRLHRLEHVQSGRENFVLDLDRADRDVTDVLAVGGDDGDR